MNLPTEPRMYVLVRKELDQTYRNVQGTHAALQYALEHTNSTRVWNNQYLIFLGVRFPSGIREWEEKLTAMGLKYSVFYEPDIDQVTSLACIAEPSVFKDLPLA
jgi:hypothetical protein